MAAVHLLFCCQNVRLVFPLQPRAHAAVRVSYSRLVSKIALASKPYWELKDLLRWYAAHFKDPMVLDPPEWFQSFIFCEALLQLPFFPVAAYAFFKGGCRWIRTPAIVYSAHVATSLIPILAHVLFSSFPLEPHPGPQTTQERWLLVSIYAPYLIVPLLLLLTMLLSRTYSPTSKPGNTTATKKRK